jgi:hypothetical protein
VIVRRSLVDFSFDYLGGIPMGIGDVDLSSCALQFFQTLHLKKIVVAWGEVADKSLPGAVG